MSKTYRAGLIGCGRMGATIDDEVKDRPHSELFLPYSHAAALAACPRIEFVAVCDPVEEKAKATQQRYGVASAYTDYREMIRQEKLDLVSIATRPGPHAETTIFAAENGVGAVYCEKPLCNSMREADAMLEACRRHGVKFNYGTQRRYAPIYRQVRQLCDEGRIGQVQAVVANCGVSVAQWGHTHAADMMLFLAGDGEAEFVQGHAVFAESDWEGQRLKIDPSITSGYVHFKNGVHAYLVAAGGSEFEVSGTKGKLRTLSNGIGYTLRTADEFGELHEEEVPATAIASGTLKSVEDLVAALDTGGDTQGSLELACRSQELIFGIIASHRQGGRRVELPLAERDLSIAPDHY
ncbi:MAG: Gfo/Idh/MocA family oxidoreductase [Candidatus Latescibacteria bacterium]|nr:Gfo/Idh/MocA family oxidoreductase [Candidatus Latescibacterota bacterium]